jgi:hypothetical protein
MLTMGIRTWIAVELARLALQLVPKKVETLGYSLTVRKAEHRHQKVAYNRTQKK